jgi:hypothetical protein
MSSFAKKLARLDPSGLLATGQARSAASAATAKQAPVTTEGITTAPSLDALREKIAQIVARGRPQTPTPRADPAKTELPFAVEETPHGVRYVRRERTLPGARVGRVPLISARDAEGEMLALLALDPKLASCDPRRALYVDTETTGLAGGTGTVPFLLGLAWTDDDGALVMEQVLLRRLGEEAPILALLTERIAQASMLVSFNGKSFDMPLLRTRYVMNRMPAPVEPPHLDLVHVARRLHGGRLTSRTLASIENEILGRGRVDDIAGGDIVSAYAHFLRSGDEEALAQVVVHNEADVLSMVALVGLYGEPVTSLDPRDLACAARAVHRAGDTERAALLAEEAVDRGGGALAKRARGDLAKARGDRARALTDYESVAGELDDPGVRLELAKLYEHHVRSFADALAVVAKGTGEDDAALEKRKNRLEKKASRAQSRKKP